MRYALKYAYDGSLFEGSQRFRRERGTVDGEILHVLYRMGAV
ncbi:tRNA pseudouridine(38-40) synthase TruA, partial [Candidatus Micrarchaeota archaeon]